MTLRRILFWSYLATGVLAGLVILVMASTGVLLAHQRQVLQWANREYRVAATGQPSLSVAEIMRRVDLQ